MPIASLIPSNCKEKATTLMMIFEFVDLKSQYRLLENEIQQGMQAVMRHGQFILGPEVKALEEKLAAHAGVKHCVACSSGTDALLIALMALGVGHGDEVITSPFSFIATAEVIALIGARPVFVDIDPRSYNLHPELIETAITARTKAIMPVSLYGQCADFDRISAIASKYNLPVIEDAAQSFGATYKGKKSCALSRIGCTSFFPSKPLGCYGDGGACFTDDGSLAAKMRHIMGHGQDRRYHHVVFGINGRLDTLQAAVLLAKLKVFQQELEARTRVADQYLKLLNGAVKTPYIEPFNISTYAQYTIEAENRDALQNKLSIEGIPTAVHYPVPLHLQPVFASLKQNPGSFPVSEHAALRVLSLPMHAYLKEPDVELIASAVKKAVEVCV
jgi:UDP-2-acetamido-2-deoxy-ribo-hexuluronate aminotransferase